MSNNAEFEKALAEFLKRTDFPAGLSEQDAIFQTSLAVIVVASRASKALGGRAYTIADLASQGIHGGGPGPHISDAPVLKMFGMTKQDLEKALLGFGIR